MPVSAMAGAAVSAVGAAGWGAYKYNRSNFLYDQGLRYKRYTAGYSMACEQASMYREDIRDLTAITISKQDLYHVVGVIFYVITFQLIMAGRLGVHGPVPPGWLMGIHYTCGALAMLFLTLSTWLAMHASARANSGMAYMLTRQVRLPIPTASQLDRARKFGNSYETSRLSDMLRVPFFAPAPLQSDPFAEEDKKKKSEKDGSDGKRKLPKWYRDESGDLYQGSGGCCPTTPEHFELYRGLQQEWWCHDIYARISLLYFMSSWTHSAAFYIQCHAFGELRAIWVAWSCTIVFVAAHFCLLKIDIISDNGKNTQYSFPVERFVPVTPLLTCLGMSLEYSIIEPSNGVKGVIYVIAWICYILHFAWALRMYDIATPTSTPEKADLPTQPWWPQEWWLPQAFSHALYLVAAPKKVDDDQTCLQQEMRAAMGNKSGEQTLGPAFRARETLPALFAYKIFRGACFAMIGMWMYMIFGRIIEQLHGERMLARQEGRVERWPSHMQPWMPPWTRQGKRDEWAHTGGSDRRLGDVFFPSSRDEHIAAVAQRLNSVLSAVSETLDHELALDAASGPIVPPAPIRQAKVAWPPQLPAPTVLACGNGGAIAALTADARLGATVKLPEQTGGPVEAPTPFSLRFSSGDNFDRLLGASWSDKGLLVATSNGVISECVQNHTAPAGAAWVCEEVSARLPSGGSAVQLAAAARLPGTSFLRVAVVFEGDEAFTLLEERGNGWEPAGEVLLPVRPGHDSTISGQRFSLSMSPQADELLVTSAEDGHVIRVPLGGAAPVVAAAPHTTSSTLDMVWRGTCGIGGGRLAHLVSKKRTEATFVPELFVSARA